MDLVSFSDASQIIARMPPCATDPAVVLASGAAGAFAFGCDDVAHSFADVATTISLVPPLSVPGISLSQGQWDAATKMRLVRDSWVLSRT